MAGSGQGDVRHLVSSVHGGPEKFGMVKFQKGRDILYLVSAVESRPSARPLANDLRAGGPGGDGGAGAIPGT